MYTWIAVIFLYLAPSIWCEVLRMSSTSTKYDYEAYDKSSLEFNPIDIENIAEVDEILKSKRKYTSPNLEDLNVPLGNFNDNQFFITTYIGSQQQPLNLAIDTKN